MPDPLDPFGSEDNESENTEFEPIDEEERSASVRRSNRAASVAS